jgi:hypothetical protein
MLIALWLLAVSFAGAANASEAPRSVEMAGRCAYPPAAAKYRFDTAFALCDALTIESRGASAVFDFRQKSWGSSVRFSGAMTGSRMTVRRVAFRSGDWAEATGTCEVFYRSGTRSVVTCFAKAGARSYAANFVVSRL